MLDIKFVRENPESVKENIQKKFQDTKLDLVDKAISLDIEIRDKKFKADELRALRNKISKQIGGLMKEGKKEEAEVLKQKVTAEAKALAELEEKEGQTVRTVERHYDGAAQHDGPYGSHWKR